MKSPTRRGSRLRRIVLTALSMSLVAGMALLSPAVAQASTNSMTGELRVGQTLTIVTDCPGGGSSFVWHRDNAWGWGEGAGTRHTVRASAVGHQLVATFECEGFTQWVASGGVVLPAKFDTVGTPGVSGEPQVGQPLSATPGSWSPTPDSYSYKWFRGASEIANETSATYVPKAEDLDQTLTVQVTASLAGYEDAAADSAPTAKVAAGLIEMITAPALSGTARVGETVTASAGEWSPKPSRVSYQWWRGGDQIEGATSPSYTLVDADHGRWSPR